MYDEKYWYDKELYCLCDYVRLQMFINVSLKVMNV